MRDTGVVVTVEGKAAAPGDRSHREDGSAPGPFEVDHVRSDQRALVAEQRAAQIVEIFQHTLVTGRVAERGRQHQRVGRTAQSQIESIQLKAGGTVSESQ